MHRKPPLLAASIALLTGFLEGGAPPMLSITLKSANEEVGGHFGWSVSGAADVDGDGFADVIVGAPNEDPGTSPDDAGRAYIFSSQDGRLLVELNSPNEEPQGLFGFPVASAGDVNQDGLADVIVGALSEDPGTSPDDAGRAYIFSSQDGSLLYELISPNEENGGSFGASVSDAGDVNQDGSADVIVGARNESPGTSPDYSGRAYIFSGENGTLLFELISPGEELDGSFGSSVSSAGDVNKDGFADVIVGAWLEDPGTSPVDAGRAYIFSGKDGSLLSELISPNEEFDGFFGYSVSAAGDVNQDGLADVIVGAPGEDPSTSPPTAGRAYLFSGQNGGLLGELISPNQADAGFFGYSVSGAGDVNEDGFADVIVGAPLESPGTSPTTAGRVYLFSGLNGSLLSELISPNEEFNGLFGISVSGAGDVNQDGASDVIVGAINEDPATTDPVDAGRAYIFASGGECVQRPMDLVSWWPGDGDTQDIVGGNHGTLVGGATDDAPGMVAEAFGFNGETGAVRALELGGPLDGFDKLTLDAWIHPTRLDAPDDLQGIVTKYDTTKDNGVGYYLTLVDPGKLRIGVFDRGGAGTQSFGLYTSTASVIPLDLFTHVAGVWDGGFISSSFHLYVNGIEVPGKLYIEGTPAGMADNMTPVNIGRFEASQSTGGQPFGHFQGQIDEVEILSRALAASDIQAIVNAGAAGKCKAPDAAAGADESVEERTSHP